MELQGNIQAYLSQDAQDAGVSPFIGPRSGDAGYDLRSSEALQLKPGEQHLIRTGLHLSIPDGWVGLIFERSSTAKKRLYVYSGVIDSSYRGEVQVVAANGGEVSINIEINDKIAQMVVVPHLLSEVVAVTSVEDLGLTERGAGGFGSTGRQ